MPQDGGQRALLIADSDIPTTGLVARELREVFASLEVRIAPDIFGAAVTGRPVIVSRLCFPRYSWLPGHLAREGVRYAYFIDDNFWEITTDIDVRLARFFRHPATVDTLDAFVRHAAVVVTWSEPLRGYVASRFPGISAEFVPPGFDVAKAADAPSAAPSSPTTAKTLSSGSAIRRRRDHAYRHSLFPSSSTFCAHTTGA